MRLFQSHSLMSIHAQHTGGAWGILATMASGRGPPATVPAEGGEWGAKRFLARKRRGRALALMGGRVEWTCDVDDTLFNDINVLACMQCDGVSDDGSTMRMYHHAKRGAYWGARLYWREGQFRRLGVWLGDEGRRRRGACVVRQGEGDRLGEGATIALVS